MSYDRTDKRQNRDYYYFKNDLLFTKNLFLNFIRSIKILPRPLTRYTIVVSWNSNGIE